MIDAVTKANVAWRALHDPHAPDLMTPQVVGREDRPIEFLNGVSVRPTVLVGESTPDLVVVPALDEDVRPSLARNLDWVE